MKISADLILSGNQWFKGHCLHVDGARIKGLCTSTEPDQHYANAAIIPGFANVHSHSFQRVIRGQTEWLKAGTQDDFWSWRTAMYRAASQLSPEQVESVAEWTFLEMLKAGVTAVGEFHYLHHQPDGTPYAQVSELSQRVISAATRVGIRITHLPVAYARGGFNQPILNEQRRFVSDSSDAFLSLVDELRTRYLNHSTVQVGLAPHSIRAVNTQWLDACSTAARGWSCPLHIHVCEQLRELKECHGEHGLSPIELLAKHQVLGDHTTLIHATHLSKNDIEHIARTKSLVGACPTTEANLGDGFLPSTALLEHNVRISLGTDSHAQIDLFQEARNVDMQQRLLLKQRNPLARFGQTSSLKQRTSDVLWPMMTTNGYQSLGIHGGTLTPGALADFIVVDLSHPACLGSKPEDLLDTLILAGQPDAIKAVFVNGKAVLQDRVSPSEEEIRTRYLSTVKALASG
jgi:formimidoylglutamate deiminase